jgi:hypothetical protein
MSGDERTARWVRWADSVVQPLGTGASDETLRQSIGRLLAERGK